LVFLKCVFIPDNALSIDSLKALLCYRVFEEFHLLGYSTVQSVESWPIWIIYQKNEFIITVRTLTPAYRDFVYRHDGQVAEWVFAIKVPLLSGQAATIEIMLM
jgi:hypothetical protein